MDEELKKLLQRNLEVSEESLKILKKISRARIMAAVYNTLKLAIIILLSVGAYYYVEPMINNLMGTLNQLTGGAQSAQQIQDLLKQYKLPR
ncbi:MAG: hypothetical protein HZC14_00820 [Candidatus Niyogibacteria bacterium]|nr:hypothetical protein [Candidatus Niyogibacteria bacterium]